MFKNTCELGTWRLGHFLVHMSCGQRRGTCRGIGLKKVEALTLCEEIAGQARDEGNRPAISCLLEHRM